MPTKAVCWSTKERSIHELTNSSWNIIVDLHFFVQTCPCCLGPKKTGPGRATSFLKDAEKGQDGRPTRLIGDMDQMDNISRILFILEMWCFKLFYFNSPSEVYSLKISVRSLIGLCSLRHFREWGFNKSQERASGTRKNRTRHWAEASILSLQTCMVLPFWSNTPTAVEY